jgi:nucleoside-diphosphate-sugar epimerase
MENEANIIMNKILLTGASGTVGREVLKQLCDMPDKVELTVFDKESKESREVYRKISNKFNLVWGDISIKSDISKVCIDKDVVIHLAAIIPPLADRKPELANQVNVIGTKNLIESIEEHSPLAFFLYSSSISVYGDRNNNPWIKTTDPLKPSDRDEYARTKIAAEKILTESRLKWSILRLTAIMGVNNHKPSSIMFHMPLDSYLEIATPGDTGRAFVNALCHLEELDKKIFNLSGGENCRITYKDFLSRSFEISGLGKADFLEKSFAGKNFHCGYYQDGDILNDILHFRRETLDDYFLNLKKGTPFFKRILTILFRKFIKRGMQKKSEPLAAITTNNLTDIQHYF